MFDRDDSGNRFSDMVRVGLVLASMLVILLWLTTCRGFTSQSQQAADAEMQSLLGEDGESSVPLDPLEQLRKDLDQAKLDYESQINTLQEKLLSTEQAVSALETDKVALEGDIARITTELQIASDKNQSLQTELKANSDQYAVERQQFADERQSMSENVKMLDGQLVRLGAEANRLKEQLAALSQQNAGLQEDAAKWASSQSEMQTLSENHESETATLKQQVQALLTEKAQLQNALSTKTIALGDMEAKMLSSLDDANSQTEKAQQQSLSYEDKIAALNQEMSSLQAANLEMQTRLYDLNQALSQGGDVNAQLKTEIESLKSALAGAAQTAVTDDTAGDKSEVAILETEVLRLLAENSNLQSLVSDLSVQKLESVPLQSAQMDGAGADAEEEQDGEQLALLMAELDEQKGLNQSLESQLAELQAQLSSTEIESEPVQQEISSLTEKNQSLENDIEVLTGKLVEKEAEVLDLSKQLSGLKTNEDELKQQLANVDSDLAESKETVASLQQTVASLEGNKDNLLLQLTELNQQQSAQTEQLSLLQQASDKSSGETQELETLIIDIRAEKTQLEAELQQLKATLTANGDELEGLQSKLSSSVSELGALEVQLEQSTGDLDSALSELAIKNERISSLESQLVEQNQVALPSAEAKQLESDLRDKLAQAGLDNAVVDIRENNKVGVLIGSGALFGSGRSYISSEGYTVMNNIAEALKAYPNHQIRIEGHTDNVPVGASIKATFPSNWELSVARAAAAVRFLQEAGLPATQLSAAGFGEFQPVADNATVEGRNANRRIEIILKPDN